MREYKLYLSLDIRRKKNHLFNRTKEKNEVFSFQKYPCPMCHYTLMIDSCPEGLVSGKANKWPKENSSLGAGKQ